MAEEKKPGIRISQRDRDRFCQMDAFEGELRERGYRAVAGVDEAGRGPLAGPVVAAACILPASVQIYGLNDSKKMTAKRRDYLSGVIRAKAVAWAIAGVEAEEIDRTNILQATKEAMRRALAELPRKPDLALIDALALSGLDYPVLAEIKGDARHNVIAAASILAKTARDGIMESWDKIYPQYGFASHKGYGTAAHMEAIRQYGPCPIHRQSFLGGICPQGPADRSPYHTGLQVEGLVARDLMARGHSILEHRFALDGIGEIDLITCREETIFIIECKGRGASSQAFGGLGEALEAGQIRRIRQAAACWLDRHADSDNKQVTLLYAAVDLSGKEQSPVITYLPFD